MSENTNPDDLPLDEIPEGGSSEIINSDEATV
jgi:hypothetical protein